MQKHCACNTKLLLLIKNNSMEKFRVYYCNEEGETSFHNIQQNQEKQRFWFPSMSTEGFILGVCRQIPHYKDTEGNAVFTNDKMSLQYFGESKEGVVVFDERKLRYALDISNDRDMSVLIPLCEVDGVVVGNIHDEK